MYFIREQQNALVMVIDLQGELVRERDEKLGSLTLYIVEQSNWWIWSD